MNDPLAGLAAQITAPTDLADLPATAHLAERWAGYGCLGELALWWVAVRGTFPTPVPARVRQVLAGVRLPAERQASSALPVPVTAEVTHCGQDLPGPGEAAVAWGREQAHRAADDGVELLLLTVADPAAALVSTAHLLRKDPVEAAGWPLASGRVMRPDDRAWMAKVAALREGLRELRAIPAEPRSLLVAQPSGPLTAGTSLLLQAAARRTPVLLDGPGAIASALLAQRIAPAAALWWRLAQGAQAGPQVAAQEVLGLEPILRLGLEVEDGTGALLGLSVLAAAAALANRS